MAEADSVTERQNSLEGDLPNNAADSVQVEITPSGEEAELENKLADYASSNWVNSTPDIYGKSDDKNEEYVTAKQSDTQRKQADNLKAPPLPTESDLDDMLAEIRQLEQEEATKLNDEAKENLVSNNEG